MDQCGRLDSVRARGSRSLRRKAVVGCTRQRMETIGQEHRCELRKGVGRSFLSRERGGRLDRCPRSGTAAAAFDSAQSPRLVQSFEPERVWEQVFPVFAIGDQFFYGFPDLLGQGVKVAIHWGQNEAIEDPSASVSVANEADVASVLSKVRQYIPTLGSDARRAATCLYTMTTDEHFIVDRHPLFDNVVLAAGFSGHGFKFAPVIGEALADFCTLGESGMPALFRINRFASSRI